MNILKTIYTHFSINLKLRYKLSIVYTLVVIIFVVIVGEYSYYWSEAFMLKEIVSSLSKELVQVADDLDYKLELCRKVSDLIYYDKQFKRVLSEDYTGNDQLISEAYIDYIKPTFGNFSGNFKLMYDIRVYTTNTSLIKDNTYIFDMEDIEGDSMYSGLIQKETLPVWLPARLPDGIEQDETGIENNEKVLTLSRGIFSYSGRFLGILNIYLPLSTVDKVLSNLKLPAEGAGIYVNLDGQIITSFGRTAVNPSTVDGILRQQDTSGIIETEDGVCVFKKTLLNNCFLIIIYPQKYISEKVDVIKQITRWMIVISVVSVLIISFFLSNLVTRRLGKLVNKIKRIQDTGRTNPGSIIPGMDEAADIDRAFSKMISRINELTEEKLQSEITRKSMEMEILQSQINPHFLYNTLASIKWAIANPGEKDSGSVIDSIVKFYRLSLSNGNEIIRVGDELQIVREYVNIQKFTYDGSFEVIWDVDEGVYSYSCIKLILQPFVENAILHGLNQKKQDACLKIGAYLENGVLYFVVEDNGGGFDTEILMKASEAGKTAMYKGFGINNSIERLRLTYGEKYGFSIRSIVDKGTKVVIEIPAITFEEKLFLQGL